MGTPSSLSTEYWQSGATQMRLRTVTERMVCGEKSVDSDIPSYN